MSNSYLQFCEALVLRDPGEKAWFERYLRASYFDSSEDGDGTNWDKDNKPLTDEGKFWDPVLSDTEDEMALFEWEFQELDGKSCVIFSSEDHGCVNHAAQLVQHFFKDMRPEGKDGFSISWAETCDKSMPGQFGGGACFITKNEIHWVSTWQWVDELAQQLKVDPQ